MTATDPATVRREAMEEASRIADKRQTMLEAKGRRHPDNSPSREACAQAAYEAMWLASAIRGAATRPAEATGDVKLVETRQRLREIILGWSGLDESDLEPIVDAIMREVIVPVDRGYAILGRTYDGVDVLQPKTPPSAFLLGLVGKPDEYAVYVEEWKRREKEAALAAERSEL